jgi:hypothetical protein
MLMSIPSGLSLPRSTPCSAPTISPRTSEVSQTRRRNLH